MKTIYVAGSIITILVFALAGCSPTGHDPKPDAQDAKMAKLPAKISCRFGRAHKDPPNTISQRGSADQHPYSWSVSDPTTWQEPIAAFLDDLFISGPAYHFAAS